MANICDFCGKAAKVCICLEFGAVQKCVDLVDLKNPAKTNEIKLIAIVIPCKNRFFGTAEKDLSEVVYVLKTHLQISGYKYHTYGFLSERKSPTNT